MTNTKITTYTVQFIGLNSWQVYKPETMTEEELKGWQHKLTSKVYSELRYRSAEMATGGVHFFQLPEERRECRR